MKLNYREAGEGPRSIIILHGLFGMSDNWMTLARKIGEKFRVIVPDMRNHGQSPHSDSWDYKAMAEDVVELIEDLDLEWPVILGHSMGGKVAMKLAVTNPEIMSKLIVADIAPRYYPVGHQLILDALKSVDFGLANSREDVETVLADKITNPGIRLFLMKNLGRDNEKELKWKFNLNVIAEKIDNAGEEIRIKTPINIPTLFIRGALSDYIRQNDISEIEEKFDDVKVETLDDAGHWLHADQPLGFMKMVEDFIG